MGHGRGGVLNRPSKNDGRCFGEAQTPSRGKSLGPPGWGVAIIVKGKPLRLLNGGDKQDK